MPRSPQYEDDAAREGVAPESPDDQTAGAATPEAVTEDQVQKAARPKRTRKSAESVPPDKIVRLTPHADDVPKGDEEGEAARRELESRGFSADEASRIVFLSERLADSREARDAEATLRRLRFTRWLVEHGMLDEWSA